MEMEIEAYVVLTFYPHIPKDYKTHTIYMHYFKPVHPRCDLSAPAFYVAAVHSSAVASSVHSEN